MKVKGITPNLVTDDVGRSLAFYRDVLGFTAAMTVPDEAPFVFVMLERDGVNVFLNATSAVREDLPEVESLVAGKSGVAMFVLVEGVRDYYEDIRGTATVVMPLKEQWYGMTEFSVVDPDGYILTFAERRAE